MASILWILLTAAPLLLHAESGDDEYGVVCTSTLTIQQSSLSCLDEDGSVDEIEHARLCLLTNISECYSVTMEQNSFSFLGLPVWSKFKLQVQYKNGQTEEQEISLAKIVNLPAPEVENVTFKDDEAIVHIGYKHDYVTDPEFQVELRGKSGPPIVILIQNLMYKHLSIAGATLKHRETYKVRARVRPVNYFGGPWSEWSLQKSFTVNKEYGFVCTSTLTLQQSGLSCYLDEDGSVDDIKSARLCQTTSISECFNVTMEQNSFSFRGLRVLPKLKLQVQFKNGQTEEQEISLAKIVNLPAPEVENVTFIEDEAIVHIGYKHDYVTEPEFQVELNGTSGDHMVQNVTYKHLSIAGATLKHRETYKVRVRAIPVNYFGGPWSEWSSQKSFTVNKDLPARSGSPPLFTYVLISVTLFLVFLVGLVVNTFWKKEIQGYLSPNIPHPKTTLALIHRDKQFPPVSFSPEIFNDVKINAVVYAEEKRPPSELHEAPDDTTGCCEEESAGLNDCLPALLCEELHDERAEEEMSHLKIRLLAQSDLPKDEEKNKTCQTVAAPQRDFKDETYVSMSSLYKTQSG